MEKLEKLISTYENFPQAGVSFRDVMEIAQHPSIFRKLISDMAKNKIIEENVTENTNLVVQAGIKKFPYPYLKYKCGMGTCGTCASLIISGKKNLPEPTWKEVKVLKEKLDLGYRLACQFRISHDIEIKQD